MSENKKPRLAEVLGVEVGEKFEIEAGVRDPFYVNSEGLLLDRDGIDRPALAVSAINHPEIIKRRPHWTEQEVEDAKAIARLIPMATDIRRSVTNSLSIVDPFDDIIVGIDSERFPSIPAGKGAYINDIIGGNE